MNKQFAVSIDVDTVASHLKGYGINDSQDEDSVFSLAIPRFLELLKNQNSKATFFLVAAPASKHNEVVARIAQEGHEVASHSFSHQLPFNMKLEEARERELVSSKRLLEELSQTEVLGFRAPSWDASPELFEGLASAGYQYDASLFPSWMLMLLRREVAKRHEGVCASLSRSDFSTFFGKAGIHSLNSGLLEIPISTSLLLRVPYYHSLSYLVPGFAQRLNAYLANLRPGPLTYIFHAVDFLGLDEDGIDPRLARHPGMKLPLAKKLEMAEGVFSGRQSVALKSLI